MKKFIIVFLVILLPVFISANNVPKLGGEKTAEKIEVKTTDIEDGNETHEPGTKVKENEKNAAFKLPARPTVAWTSERFMAISLNGEKGPVLSHIALYNDGPFPEKTRYDVKESKTEPGMYNVLYKTTRFGPPEYVTNKMLKDFHSRQDDKLGRSTSKIDPKADNIRTGSMIFKIWTGYGPAIEMECPWTYMDDSKQFMIIVPEPHIKIKNTQWGYTVRKVALYGTIGATIVGSIFYSPVPLALIMGTI